VRTARAVAVCHRGGQPSGTNSAEELGGCGQLCEVPKAIVDTIMMPLDPVLRPDIIRADGHTLEARLRGPTMCPTTPTEARPLMASRSPSIDMAEVSIDKLRRMSRRFRMHPGRGGIMRRIAAAASVVVILVVTIGGMR
jgi:hypothetical protein